VSLTYCTPQQQQQQQQLNLLTACGMLATHCNEARQIACQRKDAAMLYVFWRASLGSGHLRYRPAALSSVASILFLTYLFEDRHRDSERGVSTCTSWAVHCSMQPFEYPHLLGQTLVDGRPSSCFRRIYAAHNTGISASPFIIRSVRSWSGARSYVGGGVRMSRDHWYL
jgi:hypothetical protein